MEVWNALEAKSGCRWQEPEQVTVSTVARDRGQGWDTRDVTREPILPLSLSHLLSL